MNSDIKMKVETDNELNLSIDGIVYGEGGGGTSDYNDLTNKPSINNVELSGNKTLAQIGAASVEQVDDLEDALANKANIDGAYKGMTVGNAEQLVSTVYEEDQVPYKFRTSGGSADIGNRETDMIVGGTIAWNQLVPAQEDIVLDFDTKRTFGFAFVEGTRITASNKYFMSLRVSNSENCTRPLTVSVYARPSIDVSATRDISLSIPYDNPEGLVCGVFESTIGGISTGSSTSTVGNTWIYGGMETSEQSGATATLSDFQLIDLTKLFGTTIANYIYNLEQSTPGAGVAWFRKLFPNDYYPYDAGTLKSVEGLQSHDTVGFNALDPATGKAKVVGGKQYEIVGNYTTLSLDGTAITPVGGLFTPDHNGTLTVTGGGADTCVHLTWSGSRNGEYEEYVKHSYPLDSTLTLRGIPKLDINGNLYYDGDTYESDGTVTRKYGIVDLGTLNWTYNSGNAYFGTNKSEIGMLANSSAFMICSQYSLGSVSITPSIYQTTNAVRIKDDRYTDAATFKPAMSGVYLVYELATPTTEQADPYQNPQIVDDWGTEEYVTDSIVPVGHVTQYMANLRDKLQHLPNLASGDGTYAVQQTGSQMALVPLPGAVSELPEAPTANGTYTLRCTVSDGVATYSWG